MLQCTARTYRSMTLQNITATTVLIKAAARAGPAMAVGFTLPYVYERGRFTIISAMLP